MHVGALLAIAAIWHGPLPALVPAFAQRSAEPNWPALPTTGFISGRPATDKDVADGNAVFVLRAYGIAFGKPLDVTIPQYAYLNKARPAGRPGHCGAGGARQRHQDFRPSWAGR